MKRVIIIGVLVVIAILVLLSFRTIDDEIRYEYYDLNGDYGTSSECRSTIENLICKNKKGWIKVSQYSEVSE